MTKQDLFEIDLNLKNKYNDYKYTKLFMHHFYNNYYEELFSKYSFETLWFLMSSLVNFDITEMIIEMKVFKASEKEIEEKVSARIDYLIKDNLYCITKILDFYEEYNLPSIGSIYAQTMSIILHSNDNRLFEDYLKTENLNAYQFINDLYLLNQNFSKYKDIKNTCKNNNCSLKELIDLIRHRKGNLQNDQTRII